MSPFIPISDHGKALAAKADRENADLVARRASASVAEKKNLSGIRGIQEGRSGIPRVNPFKIKVRPGFNARIFDSVEAQEDDAELVASIKAKGVMHALEVEIGDDGITLWLVDGERRLRATIRAINEGAPIESVPVKTVPVGTNEADLVASQLIHNSGRRYSLLELGAVVKKLLAYGWTHEKIQVETATPIARQKDSLDVVALPVAAQQMIKTGEASAKFARTTIEASATKQEGVAKLQEAVKVAKAKGRTRAMPKDLGAHSVSDRSFVTTAFNRADVVHGVSGVVQVSFHGSDYAEFLSRFPINAKQSPSKPLLQIPEAR